VDRSEWARAGMAGALNHDRRNGGSSECAGGAGRRDRPAVKAPIATFSPIDTFLLMPRALAPVTFCAGAA
jgi:hypothetical protein